MAWPSPSAASATSARPAISCWLSPSPRIGLWPRYLRAELGALGERLRAVVITDYERLSARARSLHGILDPDAGSAVRVFQHLVADPETNTLDPILVTGNVVLVDTDRQAMVDHWLRTWSADQRLDLAWEWRDTGSPWMVELAGRGRDWSSRTYVALVTQLFDMGVTRCVVGTRGLLGEGWDSPRLNTLIDLTSVTTTTGVRQLRGRACGLTPTGRIRWRTTGTWSASAPTMKRATPTYAAFPAAIATSGASWPPASGRDRWFAGWRTSI